MYKQSRGVLVLAVLSLVLLTAPVLAAPPAPQLGMPVTSEGSGFALNYTGCGGVYGVPSSNLDYEQTLVEMVNAVRAEQMPPLPPLKRVSALDDATRYHSTDMAVDNYFAHDSHDRVGGNLVLVCRWSERIATFYLDRLGISENIAAGYRSPEAVMEAWMNSDGHRANILRSSSWEIGVGYYLGGAYRHYWTQNFGRRSGVYPIVINREVATTDDYRVNLYIYGSGTWPEMRLRNNDAAWGDWRPFQSELVWELPQQTGEHTVWVELRNGAQTTTSSDTIYLNWALPSATLNLLPNTVNFVYDGVTGSLTPSARVINLVNVTSTDPIAWSVTTEGDWFTVTPAMGTTPGAFTIVPTTFVTYTSATYTGVITVTATSPLDTVNAVQRIEVTLDVRVPALGGLPEVMTFTYSIPSQQFIPASWTLTPSNVGSDHPLRWAVVSDMTWMQLGLQSGTTPQSFTATPVDHSMLNVAQYTGVLTVNVDAPNGVTGAPHQIRVSLNVVNTELNRFYLPLVYRNF